MQPVQIKSAVTAWAGNILLTPRTSCRTDLNVNSSLPLQIPTDVMIYQMRPYPILFIKNYRSLCSEALNHCFIFRETREAGPLPGTIIRVTTGSCEKVGTVSKKEEEER